ncbi:MAG: 3'-5' exonuclease domain-containing protein 2 [Bacteroidales bacterium]|nr:3'-5' exonuclease domain-containing protein 2 [Bacteroidales bacterium]
METTERYIAITKEELAPLPIVAYPGRITVVDNPREAKKALAFLRAARRVGFDTETRPSFRKGHVNTVALIQISTADHCFLFRLKKLGFHEELKDFLEDETVEKIGLSLRDDFLVLHKISEFEPRGFVDLQDFVKGFSIHDASLQKIYAILFGSRISKSQRLSNWEADTLTESLQRYASIDAWACLRIYNHLRSGNFDPQHSPYWKTVERQGA